MISELTETGGIAPCACQDVEVLALVDLMATGMTQREASLELWGPGAEVRERVRAAFMAAFPWLNLSAVTR